MVLVKLLTDQEIEFAFRDSIENGSAILAFTNHDCRNMAVDIEDIYKRINNIHKSFQNVSTINSDAVTAMRNTHYGDDNKIDVDIKIDLEISKESEIDKIIVKVKHGEVFGSQPYLALKTNDGRYYHDNFNERNYPKSWEYVLDESSIKLLNVEKIAVASNDIYGNQSIASLKIQAQC